MINAVTYPSSATIIEFGLTDHNEVTELLKKKNKKKKK